MHTLQCLPLVRNKHCSNSITAVPVSVLDLEQNRLAADAAGMPSRGQPSILMFCISLNDVNSGEVEDFAEGRPVGRQNSNAA